MQAVREFIFKMNFVMMPRNYVKWYFELLLMPLKPKYYKQITEYLALKTTSNIKILC